MAAVLDSETRQRLMAKIDSTTAKLVFHSLALEGAATASQLQRRLDLPQLTILSVLGTLAQRGVVDTDTSGKQVRYRAAI